jgi:hypothetical protein
VEASTTHLAIGTRGRTNAEPYWFLFDACARAPLADEVRLTVR